MSSDESVGLSPWPIFDLSGGMVTAYNFTQYKKNQLLRVLNSDFNFDGSLTTRRGRIKLNTIPLATNPTVSSLTAIGQTSGADLIYAGANGILWEMSSGVEVQLRTGLDVTAYIASTGLDDYKFFCNGINKPFMTKGTLATTFQVGIDPATSYAALTLAPIAGGGGTAGTHRVALRYRSTITGARSQPFISSGVIQSKPIALAGPNFTYEITIAAGLVSADPQVTTIDYFAQEAGASDPNDPYYYLGSSVNVAGVYAFGANVSDDELIIKEILDVDDAVPDVKIKDWIEWRGRILGITTDDRFVYSKKRIDGNSIIILPTSWPPDNETEIGPGDGDPVVKLINYDDNVFAFKRRSIFLLIGDIDSDQFYFQRLKTNFTNIGLLNQRSVCQGGDNIFFVTDDLKFLTFGKTDFSSQELRLRDIPPSNPIKDLFSTFAASYRQYVNVFNYTFADYTQIWINFTDGVGGFDASQNFNTFVFDYTKNGGEGAWHIHTGHQIASAVLARDANGNYRIFSGDYYGYIWKHDPVALGDGAAINGTSTGGNGATSFKDTTKIFTADLIGTFLTIIGGAGELQVRRITAVPLATELTISLAWTVTPNNTSEYAIGGIDWEVWSRHDWMSDEDPPSYDKQGWFLDIDIENFGAYGFQLMLVKDRRLSATGAIVKTLSAGGSFWNVGLYNSAVWSETQKQFITAGFDLLFKQLSHRIINKKAGQPFKLNGWTYYNQVLENVRL